MFNIQKRRRELSLSKIPDVEYSRSRWIFPTFRWNSWTPETPRADHLFTMFNVKVDRSLERGWRIVTTRVMDRGKDEGRRWPSPRQTASDDFRVASESPWGKKQTSVQLYIALEFFTTPIRRSVAHPPWSRSISLRLPSSFSLSLSMFSSPSPHLIPYPPFFLLFFFSGFVSSDSVGEFVQGRNSVYSPNYVSRHKLVRENRTGVRASIVFTRARYGDRCKSISWRVSVGFVRVCTRGVRRVERSFEVSREETDKL